MPNGASAALQVSWSYQREHRLAPSAIMDSSYACQSGKSGRKPPNPESDWLDVSVPSVSGRYIELEQQGKLGELLRLQKERERLKRNLMVTNVELSQFGNPLWLLDFYVRTGNQGRKFGSALNGEADQLERRKQKLNAEIQAVEKQITRIDPHILTIPLPQVTKLILLSGFQPSDRMTMPSFWSAIIRSRS